MGTWRWIALIGGELAVMGVAASLFYVAVSSSKYTLFSKYILILVTIRESALSDRARRARDRGCTCAPRCSTGKERVNKA